MATATAANLGIGQPSAGSAKTLSARDAAALRDILKRCSSATRDAACRFRETGYPACLPTIVHSVIERYVEPGRRACLLKARDELRLTEDLGLDSLTVTEIVMLVEEVLQISISNEELADLRTLGDVVHFIEGKVRGLPPPGPGPALVAAAASGR
jgi:acyl carrier protein